MGKCILGDYVALTKELDLDVECRNRLLADGLIEINEGRAIPTPKSKPIIQKMLDAEIKLQRGIRITTRTKIDSNDILNTGLPWTTKTFVSKKDLTLTVNPCFSYRGNPVKGLTLDKEYKPDKKNILTRLEVPKDAKSAKPVYYQQTALDGIKLVWFKYNAEGFLAIQACYHDFIVSKFKEVKWYCSNLSSLVYATEGKDICGMVMPYDTTNVIERPTI